MDVRCALGKHRLVIVVVIVAAVAVVVMLVRMSDGQTVVMPAVPDSVQAIPQHACRAVGQQ